MKIDVRYVKFIKSALSNHRLNLIKPFVVTVAGSRWLCGCDGHRLHAVPAPQTAANGYVVLDDIDGEFVSIGLEGATPPTVLEEWFADRPTKMVATLHLQIVSLPRDVCGVNPGRDHGIAVVLDAKAVPRLRVPWQPVADDDVGLDPKYVADAVRHWGQTAREESVLVGLADPHSAVVLEALADASKIPAWRAVIMPVRL